jgi:hypothetical protein
MTHSPRVYGAKKLRERECHLRMPCARQTPNKGKGAEMGTKRRSIKKIAGAVDDKQNVARAKLPPRSRSGACKGREFLIQYQASRALQRPGQRSLCQVRRFACCEVLNCTVLYCNPLNDTAARAQHPCLDFHSHSHFQTASTGPGPVKSRHLAVAEAGNLVTLGLEKWAAVCRAHRKF